MEVESISAKSLVEAILFASPEPVLPKRLADYLKMEEARVHELVQELNEEYNRAGRVFYIRFIGQGYQFYVRSDFGPSIREFFRVEGRRLSKSALDVLAIVAIKQPVTKRVIDTIRRASSDSIIHNLLELGLIRIAGKAPGTNAYLYATTTKFLTLFGLKDLSELPTKEELEHIVEYSGDLFQKNNAEKQGTG